MPRHLVVPAIHLGGGAMGELDLARTAGLRALQAEPGDLAIQVFCAPSFDAAVAVTFRPSDRTTLSGSRADPGPRLRLLETIELSDEVALALAGRIENVRRQKKNSELDWLDGTSGLVRIAWPDGSSSEEIGHYSVDPWMREVGAAVASVAAEALFRRPARLAALEMAAELDPGFEDVRLSGPPWRLRIAPRLSGPPWRLRRAAVERIGPDDPLEVDLTDCRLDEHLIQRMVRFGQTHAVTRWKLCPDQVSHAEAAGLAPIDVVVGD